MQDFIKIQEEKLKTSAKEAGYSIENIKLLPSNMKNLGDYQYNGIMSLAKEYHQNPKEIAEKIVNHLNIEDIEKISIDGPGFINITFKDTSLYHHFNEYVLRPFDTTNKTIVLDYGGPNVAKALHVGHLRSANIGEALKRLAKYLGYNTIADVHLGDFGRPLGLVILELKYRHPDWIFFQEDYVGEYPKEESITNELLEEIYPYASNRAKEDDAYLEEARIITTKLQKKEKGYYDLWKQIVEVSVNNIKEIYKKLNVEFDLWKGESDAEDYVDDVINYLKEKNLTRISEGALIIDTKEEEDTKEMPPLLLIKSNQSVSYETTDIATIWDRMKNICPDDIWYIVDNRQSLHFEQVFRVCKKSQIVGLNTNLEFLGFGTMNGKDGRPFKTRDGSVMKLETLIDQVYQEVKKKVNPNLTLEEQEKIANIVSIAALKYADLLPVRTTDYIFDIEKFCDLNGKTGVYLLYTIVRMNSLLKKAKENNIEYTNITKLNNTYDRELLIKLLQVNSILEKSFEDRSLSYITDYLYQLSKTFNSFYDSNKILIEEDKNLQTSWLKLTEIVSNTMSELVNILGIEIPDKM